MAQRQRLSKEDWVEAALAAIAEGGVPAVAVEPLAARLGATKGSFYWHFANRDALLDAALARWEARSTTEVIEEITSVADDPEAQLRALIVRVIRAAENDRVGPALLATASHPAVADVLTRATRARIDVITTLLRQLGFPADQARHRAVLAYSAYLGHNQLAHSTPAELPATKDARRAYLDHVVRVLTAR